MVRASVYIRVHTNDDRCKINRCEALSNEHGVLVIDRRGKEWDIPSLQAGPSGVPIYA